MRLGFTVPLFGPMLDRMRSRRSHERLRISVTIAYGYSSVFSTQSPPKPPTRRPLMARFRLFIGARSIPWRFSRISRRRRVEFGLAPRS